MKNKVLNENELYAKVRQEVKQRKRFRRQIFVLTVIVVVIIVGYLTSPLSKITRVNISGNKYNNTQQIKELINIKVNDYYILKPSYVIKNKLNNTNKYKSIKIERNFLTRDINIKVVEAKYIFWYEIDGLKNIVDERNNIIPSAQESKLDLIAGLPNVVGVGDEKLLFKINKELKSLDSAFYNQISQIVYAPKEYDDEFFIFIMSGTKKVYLDLSLRDLKKIQTGYENVLNKENSPCFRMQFVEKHGSSSSAIVIPCN